MNHYNECHCVACTLERITDSGPIGIALVVFLVILFIYGLTSCSSQQLPPEACTPLKQRAYLAACERAIALECETRGEPCADKLVCIDALKEVCPQPMCPNEASPKEVTP